MPPAKKIVFWLQKGGVGKSTRCFELGTELSKTKRVGILEFDPQKDISKRVFRRPSIINKYNIQLLDAVPKVEEAGLSLSCADFDEYYERNVDRNGNILQQSPNNIYKSLAPAISGRGVMYVPHLIQVEGATINDRKTDPGLWLLPGHQGVQKYDNKVTVSYGSNGLLESRSLEGFSDLCKKMETEYALDYILVDLPPTSSPGNGHIICCSDALVMPCECDGASWEAIRDSLEQLIEFRESYEALRGTRIAADRLDKVNSPTNFQQPCTVKFLGTMQSNFNIEDGCDTPYIHSEYAFWMRKLDTEVSGLMNKLLENKLVFDDAHYTHGGVNTDCMCLCRIPNFNSLDSMAQRAGKVVARLSSADLVNRNGSKLWKGVQKNNPHNRVARFASILSDSTNRIVKLLNPSSNVNVEMENPVPDHRTAETPKAQKKRRCTATAAAAANVDLHEGDAATVASAPAAQVKKRRKPSNNRPSSNYGGSSRGSGRLGLLRLLGRHPTNPRPQHFKPGGGEPLMPATTSTDGWCHDERHGEAYHGNQEGWHLKSKCILPKL